MSETHDTTTEDAGPRLNRDQLRDLDRLRRSSTDRYVAGVAGGLGRHFGIDPTVLRVLFAVGVLFGGAGLLLYAAVWLFVPEDGRDQAPVHVSGETRRVLLIVAGAVAVLALVSDGWGGFAWHTGVWPLAVIAIIVAVIAGSRRRTGLPGPVPSATGPDAPGTAYAAAAPAGTPAGAVRSGDPTVAVEPARPTPPVPPAPMTPPAAPPRRPRRTGLVLFWPTLALLALGWGVLGIYDIDHSVAAGAYAALPLAIVGAMLVLGAFVGRPGGLILLGALLVPALTVTTVVDSVQWESQTQRYTPLTAAAVQDSYEIGNGRMVIDLSRVTDPAALDGRSVEVRGKAGELKVILPPGVRTRVHASLTVAGDIELGDHEQSGLNPVSTALLLPPGATSAGPGMELSVHGRVGHIQIDTERN